MKIVNLALTALALIPAQAYAQDAAPVARVAYADLNLATDAGVRTLDRRLGQAVRTVCGNPAAEAQLSRQLAVKSCIADTNERLTAQRDLVLSGREAPAVLAVRAR